MLLKCERKLLNILRHNEPDYLRNVFTYEHLEKNFYQSDPEELYRAVRLLLERKVKYIGVAERGKQHERFGIYLEAPGFYFREYTFKLFFERISIYLLGLLTGALFTLLTTFLSGLLHL